MSGDEDLVSGAPVLPRVIVDPADGLRNVAGHFLHGHLRDEAVVEGDEDIAVIDERLGLALNTGLVALTPTAAMDPDQNGLVLSIGRSVHAECPLPIYGVGVGDVPVNLCRSAAAPDDASKMSAMVVVMVAPGLGPVQRTHLVWENQQGHSCLDCLVHTKAQTEWPAFGKALA